MRKSRPDEREPFGVTVKTSVFIDTQGFKWWCYRFEYNGKTYTDRGMFPQSNPDNPEEELKRAADMAVERLRKVKSKEAYPVDDTVVI